MANAKKLPSGRWRCQVFLGRDANGKKIIKSFTADTKKEAEFLAGEYLHTSVHVKDVTVRRALYDYIELHRNVMSPSTIRGYDILYRNAYKTILDVPIAKLDKVILQRWIHDYAATRAPKTVRNAYAFLSSACKMQNCILPEVKLPKKKNLEYNIPTDNEVQEIVAYFKRKGYQDMVVAVLLGAYGQMRRGEICALTPADFNGNICTISKDMVQDDKKKWVIKQPKTETSNRTVKLPPFVIAEIPMDKEGRIVDLVPSQITSIFRNHLTRRLKMNYNFHSLRHYCTSTMIANSKELGLDMLFVQKRGGWKRQETMMNIYRNVMPEYFEKSEEKVIGLFDKFNNEFNSCGQTCGQRVE